MPSISTLHAREIYDSRGVPTVEVDLILSNGHFGRASVPSGASTGEHEAVELRDEGETRLHGKGVRRALANIREQILPAIKDREADQVSIDQNMIDLDGTPNKSRLGANAVLAVSLALAKAVARSRRQPLWDYFRGLSRTVPDGKYVMPVPMFNFFNGGRHADKSSDFQEFMVLPIGATSFAHAMEMGAGIYMEMKRLVSEMGFATAVGDEGGFALQLNSNQKAVELLVQAIEKAGYQPGTQAVIGMDVAASEFFQNGQYVLASEQKTLSAQELIALYADWVNRYPIALIEDALEDDSWADFRELTQQLGSKVQIVGDDLFVTNVKRLQQGIAEHVGNAIIIKVNQIGTVTETIQTIDLARSHGYHAIISHRSGETEDTTISDMVVGLSTGQIKTGSLARSERVAKYNQLLRIEEALGSNSTYAGASILASQT